MKLKILHLADVAEIQEAVSDELKKIQKEEFSAAFQKLYEETTVPSQPEHRTVTYKEYYTIRCINTI